MTNKEGKDLEGDYIRALFRAKKGNGHDSDLYFVSSIHGYLGVTSIQSAKFSALSFEERKPHLERAFNTLFASILGKKKLSTDVLFVNLDSLGLAVRDVPNDVSKFHIDFTLHIGSVTIN